MKNYKIVSLLTFAMLLSANSCFSADGYIGTIVNKTNDGLLIITKIFPNSSAQKEGLYQGDKILEINGIDTRTLSLEEAASMLRGENGTTVKILADNLGEQKEINLLRLANVDSGIVIKKQNDNSLEIIKIYNTSGAATSGLLVGDKIIYIDKQSTRNFNEEEAKKLLYGFENSEKEIIVIRGGDEKQITFRLKDYQISEDEAKQVLSEFKKNGYNIPYAIKNGKLDVINAYIVTGNTITLDMFEYALACNQYDIADLMGKQNIDIVNKFNEKNKGAIARNAVDLLGVTAIVTANFVPAAGLAAPLLGAGSDMYTENVKRPNMEEELKSLKQNSIHKENTLLYKAIDCNNINFLKVYLKAKQNLLLALEYAITNDKDYMAIKIIENDVNPNASLRNGHTAFTFAVTRGKLQLVRTMIEHGAEINTTIKIKGQYIKPINLAIKNSQMFELLRSYGAEF